MISVGTRELKFLEHKPSDDTMINELFSKLVKEKKMIPAKRKSTVITKNPLNAKKIKQKDWWKFYQEAKEDN
jgi:hypothetical protein